jgi:hypothetical protein
MKNTKILLYVLLGFIATSSLICMCLTMPACSDAWLNYQAAFGIRDPDMQKISLNYAIPLVAEHTTTIIFCSLTFIASITAFVLVFKSKSLQQLLENSAENRAAARAEKAEAEKQRQISELQAKLDELKKN